MLRSLNELIGYKIEATDGSLGSVYDFFFDDQKWALRYMVVDTGSWLPGRLVLIYPFALEKPDWANQKFPVDLSKEDVENGPPIDSDKPVSRQKEIELFQHYKWDPYWMYSEPFSTPEFIETSSPAQIEKPGEVEDPSLRSFREVKDYYVHARDGDVGHNEDMLVDDEDWMIRYLVVDTRNWMPGKKVIISPSWIRDINWAESKITVDHTEDEIRNSPEFDPSVPVNREYEARLYDYYGRPVYWEPDTVNL